MSQSTISTFQLFALIPDAETARLYLEARLWPNGTVCPTCAGQDRITARKDGFHRCNKCKLDFTVRTGTIFERSHVPLHKWIYAMYLMVTARKGISSMQLAKEIGVTQKSAWFMLQRLREACGGNCGKLAGIKMCIRDRFYGPGEGEIVISGQFDPAEIKRLVGELFGDWKSPAKYERIKRCLLYTSRCV